MPLCPVTKSERWALAYVCVYWTVVGLRQKDSGSWSFFVPLGISDFLRVKGGAWRAREEPRTALLPLGRRASLGLIVSTCPLGWQITLAFPRGQTAGSVAVLFPDWTEPSHVLLSHRQAPHNPTKGRTLPQQRTAPPTARIARPLSRIVRPSTLRKPGCVRPTSTSPDLQNVPPERTPKCTEGTRAEKRAACAHSSRVCAHSSRVCAGDCWSARLRSEAP